MYVFMISGTTFNYVNTVAINRNWLIQGLKCGINIQLNVLLTKKCYLDVYIYIPYKAMNNN